MRCPQAANTGRPSSGLGANESARPASGATVGCDFHSDRAAHIAEERADSRPKYDEAGDGQDGYQRYDEAVLYEALRLIGTQHDKGYTLT
jgi:hypothetical protein